MKAKSWSQPLLGTTRLLAAGFAVGFDGEGGVVHGWALGVGCYLDVSCIIVACLQIGAAQAAWGSWGSEKGKGAEN